MTDEHADRDRMRAEAFVGMVRRWPQDEYRAEMITALAETFAGIRADTRVAVLRDAADALRQADLATRDEREEGWQ